MGLKDWTKRDILTLFAVLIAFGSLWNTNKVEVSLNQDLNEIRGKIANYDTIISKETTTDKILIPCPNGSIIIIAEEEPGVLQLDDGLKVGKGSATIECGEQMQP